MKIITPTFMDKQSSKRKQQHNLPVYVFNINKKLVCRYTNTEMAAAKLKIKKKNIINAIHKQQLVAGKWYFSRTEEWTDLNLGLNAESTRRIMKFFNL